MDGSDTCAQTSALGVLRDLVALQAARADVDAPGAAAVVDPDLLQVRVEAAPGGDHRVASGVPERGTLAAAVTDLGHRRRDGSDPRVAAWFAFRSRRAAEQRGHR